MFTLTDRINYESLHLSISRSANFEVMSLRNPAIFHLDSHTLCNDIFKIIIRGCGKNFKITLKVPIYNNLQFCYSIKKEESFSQYYLFSYNTFSLTLNRSIPTLIQFDFSQKITNPIIVRNYREKFQIDLISSSKKGRQEPQPPSLSSFRDQFPITKRQKNLYFPDSTV